MNIFTDNKDFYPTPLALIGKMVRKLKTKPMNILEPSAGKGDIIEYLRNNHFRHFRGKISAIEIDNNLQAILKEKDINVIDSDFLDFSAPDKFDAIIANPPFSNGEQHLLKAIDIMYRGEIVFLLNAETIKNPYSNVRKDLVNKLKELNADIEYIDLAFSQAERATDVECALIHIHIERNVEDDIFKDVNDQASDFEETVKEKHELSTGKTIFEMVAEHNEITNLCIETIVNYFRNYTKVCDYVALNRENNNQMNSEDLTEKMQNQVNETLIKIRKSFWRKTLDLKEVKNRLTQKRLAEFEIHLEKQTHMNFTENNIRNFVLNLIGSYEDTLTEAVVEVFDDMTRKYAWEPDIHNKTVHYYNGWKTNDAFQVNKKVIIPFYNKSSFVNTWSGKWDLDYSVKRKLNDIDLVMNYFDGMSEYVSIAEAVEKAYAQDQSSKIVSTYFTITTYKKGTIHLTFNSEDIRRRFNITASKGKGWLPKSYGTKPIQELTHEERVLVNNFEDEKTYTKKLNQPLFAKKNLLQIEGM